MTSLVSRSWNDNIALLRESLNDSQLRINNLLGSLRYGERDLRRMLCSPIGTTVQQNGQPHAATPIFNYLIYKGYFDVVNVYNYLYSRVLRFNEPTGVGGLRNGIARENPFHLAARSLTCRTAISTLMNMFGDNNVSNNTLVESLAYMDATDYEATPLMILLSKVLDMWGAVRSGTEGEEALIDEYNLIKAIITEDLNGIRFFNVSMGAAMANNQDLQDMYDGYRQDFYDMESSFDALTGIEAAMRSKLEDGLYYYSDSRNDGLVDEYFEGSDFDTSEDDDTDNESDASDEPVWTRPVLTQDLHDRIDYALERRQQDVLIQLIRDEGNRILYANRQSISGATYFNWFILKGLEEVVTFAIGQLDSGGDLAANDKLTGGTSRWNPYHYAASSIRFDRLLNYVNLLNNNLSVVWYLAAKTTTNQGDTPLMILLNRIPDEFEDARDISDEEQGEEMGNIIDLYVKIREWMQGEGQRFVQASMARVTPDIGNKYNNIRNDIDSFENDIHEYINPEELDDDFEDNKISELIQYTVQQTVARNLANELNRAAPTRAVLGNYYTIAEFRRNSFPEEQNRLMFRVPGKDLDCDVGDYETTKFMPVKIDVQRTTPARSGEWITRHNWDKDGSGKFYLFCAEELRGYLNSHTGSYGLSVNNGNTYYENQALVDTNPFTRKKIIGVQYLTQEEIEAEQAKYTQLKSENNNVEKNRKELEKKTNEKTYKESLNLLANNSMLSILRRRLVNTERLLAEEEAKDITDMTSRQRTSRNEEIVGARNRISQLQAMISREEEKERRLQEMRRMEESKRKSDASNNNANKRQRKKLYLTLRRLKF